MSSQPTSLSEWFAPRRRVSLWIAMGWTSFMVVFALGWFALPRMAPIAAPMDRLLFAVQLAALPAAVLMMVLQGLWRVFDTAEAENPLLAAESERFKITQRVMSNTVEQTLMFVPMMLALAVRIDPVYTFALPLLVGIWCVGRLLFWGGYLIDPVYRAIGMDWTSGVASVTAFWLATTLF